MRLHNERVHRRRLGNLGVTEDRAGPGGTTVIIGLPQAPAVLPPPPPPPPPVVAPAPAPAPAPVETVVAVAPSGAPVVVTQPPVAEPTLAPPVPAPVEIAAAVAPAPALLPIASTTDESGAVSYYYANSGRYYATYAEAAAAYQAGLYGTAAVDAPYIAMGVIVDRSTQNPRYFKDGVQGGVFNGQFFTMSQIQTLAASGGADNPYMSFLQVTGTNPSAGFGFEQYVLPAAIAIITYGAASGIAAPAAVQSAPEYLTAAELAPVPESVITPTVAAPSAALPPEAFASSLAETPIVFTEAAIPETVISELPAGITPDMLATASPIAGTAEYPAITEEFFTPSAPPAMEFAPVPETVITPTEPVFTYPPVPESVITPTEPTFTYAPVPESVITPTTPAPEYLLPQEMAPAPQEYPPVSETVITPTEPVAMEFAPVPESVITPTEPASYMTEAAPYGGFDPNADYSTAAAEGGATPPAALVGSGGGAPGAPAGEGAPPGGEGGGAPPGGVANTIKQALERFFSPRSTVPVATHPQTLLEAAGQYAAENPVPGFAMAVALGVAIVGVKAAMKH